jgi:hypothetical protein
MEADQLGRLQDILQAARLIASYLKDTTEADFAAVVATAQIQKQQTKRRKQAEAAIIWSGNQIYDLCQHYKTDKLKGGLGPGCFMYIAGVTLSRQGRHG